jgi:starch synthase
VLSGILNGIDTTVWDPARDPYLAAAFDADRPAPRAANKTALQERFGLRRDPAKLLFGVISRTSAQKGIDLLLAALPALVGGGGQLVVLGSGEASLEAGLRSAAAANPQDVGAQIGYDESLAHLIQGGCDALLMPSLFEPCGLTQLCAMRYGALPVVAHVGGLCDTVIDANEKVSPRVSAPASLRAGADRDVLEAAILRALSVWRQPDVWRRLQHNAMRTDVVATARGALAARTDAGSNPQAPVIARGA